MRRHAKINRSVESASVPDAIRFLASVCDGALSLDGHGFSRLDAPLGHAIARLSVEHWDELTWWWACWLVRAYRRQLSFAGFDIDEVLTRRQRRHRVSSDAGWMPDPYGFATLRWWNGTRWTEHVRHQAESDVHHRIGVAQLPFTIGDAVSNDGTK